MSDHLDRRTLPDGRGVEVVPLIFGRARLCVWSWWDAAGEGPRVGYDDVWDYDDPTVAIAAMHAWSPPAQAEPAAWMRHAGTRRYRPGGDPTGEYVKPAD